MVLDALYVVVPHESNVAHHPRDLTGQLGHGVLVHVLDHCQAVLPRFVQLAALREGADQRAVRADDQRGSLGQLFGQLHGLLCMLDGGGQLTLSVTDRGKHLPGTHAKACGFRGHGVFQ